MVLLCHIYIEKNEILDIVLPYIPSVVRCLTLIYKLHLVFTNKNNKIKKIFLFSNKIVLQ